MLLSLPSESLDLFAVAAKNCRSELTEEDEEMPVVEGSATAILDEC